MENNTISRREFLKSSAKGGASLLALSILEGCSVDNMSEAKRELGDLNLDPNEFENKAKLKPVFEFDSSNKAKVGTELVQPDIFDILSKLSGLKNSNNPEYVNQILQNIADKAPGWAEEYKRALEYFKSGNMKLHFIPMLHKIDVLSPSKFDDFVLLSQTGVYKILEYTETKVAGLEGGILSRVTMENIASQGERKYRKEITAVTEEGIQKARHEETEWFKTRGVGRYYLAHTDKVKVVGMEDLDFHFFRGILMDAYSKENDENMRRKILEYQAISSMLAFARVINTAANEGESNPALAFGVGHVGDFLRIQALTGGKLSIHDAIPEPIAKFDSSNVKINANIRELVANTR